MGDSELIPNKIVVEGDIIVDPQERFNRDLFEQLQLLENAILDYPAAGNSIGGKLELNGNTLEIKSNGLVVDPKTIIGRKRNSDGTDMAQIFAVPDQKEGYGDNLISFRTIEKDEKTIAHPGIPEFPRYLLKINRHLDPSTLQEAQRRIAGGLGSMDYVFTSYLIADGQIGKLVHLPPYTPDSREIIEHTRGGKMVMGNVEEEDQRLLASTVRMLQDRLLLPPTNLRLVDSPDDKLELL